MKPKRKARTFRSLMVLEMAEQFLTRVDSDRVITPAYECRGLINSKEKH